MAKIEIEMNLTRSTKGTHVYTDETVNSPVKTLYINRGELPKKPPEILNIQIDYEG